MNIATKKWIFLKLSSIVLIPLMLWFIVNFVSIYDKSYFEVLNFFSDSLNKFLFIIFAYFFSTLSISEVFEDYINNEKIKNVANRALQISAIAISFLTIITIFNLN